MPIKYREIKSFYLSILMVVVLFLQILFLTKKTLSKGLKLKTLASAIANFGDLSSGTNVHAYA